MTPDCIKAKIIQAGTSQAAIAAYLGVRPASIGRVIRGQMRSARIEAELSKIVGERIAAVAPKKPGRPKTTWTGQVAAPAWDGVDRRKVVQPASAGARK